MLLESKLNQCRSDMDLMLHAPAISDLVQKIERVVISCNKLEKAMGHHLNKADILQFAGEVVNVVIENVKDKDEIKLVADGILMILGDGDE